MKSTANKQETLRMATAEAVLTARADTLHALLSGDTPKGNAIEIARAAGVLAAKRTWEMIPYCHPLPIDQIVIAFTECPEGLQVTATVTTIGKTGVEMEALTAASLAALTLYDMGKGMDSAMTISGIRVVEKRGGKSDFAETIPPNFRTAILVTSDGTHAGHRSDKSGPIIRTRLETFDITPCEYRILPDDREQITQLLGEWIEMGIDLVLTTGGTGLGPRDVTVEATRAMIDHEIPGIAEAMRAFGQRRTPYAMLSRGIVGVRGRTVIVNLPGSSRGVTESLDAIFPALLHLYPMMDGGGHQGSA